MKVIQAQLRVGDLGRGNMSDINFEKVGSDAINSMMKGAVLPNEESEAPTLFSEGEQVEI